MPHCTFFEHFVKKITGGATNYYHVTAATHNADSGSENSVRISSTERECYTLTFSTENLESEEVVTITVTYKARTN